MKMILAAALFVLSCCSAFAFTSADMRAQIDATNFIVNKGCSGTLIDAKGGYVLTANHCIDDQYTTVEKDKIDPKTGVVTKEQIRIVAPGTVSQLSYDGPNIVETRAYTFNIVSASNTYDLALLRILVPVKNTPVALSCADVQQGDVVYAVGNSFGVLYSTETTGIVSSTRRSYRDLAIVDTGDSTDLGEHGLVQHSAPIAPGNSGGALYNADGHLVGVNVRGGPSGFAFSVPLADIKTFLKDAAVTLPACK